MGPAAKMPVLLAYEALAAGCDPIGISFDEAAAPVTFEAGNYIRVGVRPRSKNNQGKGIWSISR